MIERAHWSSNSTFILAAIGSAAGLGNLWRFPFLAYEHGGAAFVLAIIIANVLVGIPLLILEVGLGQMIQGGAPESFGNIKKGFRYIGWLALVFGFMVLSYYMSVMAWGIDYLASSFSLLWGADTSNFFFNEIIQVSSGVGVIGGISWPVFTAFILGWALVYFSVWKGVKGISSIVKWTATVPFVILGILIIRALTLPGAMIGIRAFLIPDWSALLDPSLWLAAFSQVFFSLSLAFGIMIAYGSLKKKQSEITRGVLWVAFGNFMVSFLSGIAVFGTLGYMASVKGVAIADVALGGPSLPFVVFPEALSLLPTFNIIFALLFFVMFMLLAIDSAFSLLEGFAIPFKDRFTNISLKKITLLVSLVIATAGLMFTTKAGIYYLDIVDHFVTNYGLVIVGVLESFVVGWLWKRKEEFKLFVNKNSKFNIGKLWDFTIKIFTPAFLLILLVWGIVNEIKEPYGGYPLSAIIYLGVLPIFVAPIIAFVLDRITTRQKNKN